MIMNKIKCLKLINAIIKFEKEKDIEKKLNGNKPLKIR